MDIDSYFPNENMLVDLIDVININGILIRFPYFNKLIISNWIAAHSNFCVTVSL